MTLYFSILILLWASRSLKMLAAMLLLCAGCQTTVPPVQPVATNAPVIAPTSPPMPSASAIRPQTQSVFTAPQIIPVNYLIPISITNGRGCCANMAGTMWHAGFAHGLTTFAEFDATTNNFHNFTNLWDSRLPCFVFSQGMQAYTSPLVTTDRHGVLTTNYLYAEDSPNYYPPIVTSNLLRPFVYQEVIWTNTQPLPLLTETIFEGWGIAGTNYSLFVTTNSLPVTNVLSVFAPYATVTGSNAPWISVCSFDTQPQQFYFACRHL